MNNALTEARMLDCFADVIACLFWPMPALTLTDILHAFMASTDHAFMASTHHN
jgi:hypothetical protein